MKDGIYFKTLFFIPFYFVIYWITAPLAEMYLNEPLQFESLKNVSFFHEILFSILDLLKYFGFHKIIGFLGMYLFGLILMSLLSAIVLQFLILFFKYIKTAQNRE